MYLRALLLLSSCLHATLYAYRQPYIPLIGTARLGSEKLSYERLRCGENPNQSDELGNTPLHYAIFLESKDLTNLLLDFNANPNAQNKKGKTPLHIAIQKGNDYLARRLMVYGASGNIQNAQGDTPLHIATRHTERKHAHRLVYDLLCFGADKDIMNKKNETAHILAQQLRLSPTHVHAYYKQKKQRSQILTALQSPAPCRPCTPLDRAYMRAARSTHVTKLQKIAQSPGVNINLQIGKHKRSALMYAARNNRTEIVHYLIKEANVDKTLRDAYGKTAYDYARKHNNPALHALLTS
jgi:ankyrin repeat protein